MQLATHALQTTTPSTSSATRFRPCALKRRHLFFWVLPSLRLLCTTISKASICSDGSSRHGDEELTIKLERLVVGTSEGGITLVEENFFSEYVAIHHVSEILRCYCATQVRNSGGLAGQHAWAAAFEEHPTLSEQRRYGF